MVRLFEHDIDPKLILEKKVSVVGYGNQGRAHALNLRNRGVETFVGTREGRGRNAAEADGFPTLNLAEAVTAADVVMLTVPDEEMASIFRKNIRPFLNPGALLLFAHGFAVTYGLIHWSGALGLVSPIGPGTSVRSEFINGFGVPAFFSSRNVEHRDLVLSYAWAIGCARAGVIETTFEEETECDLFGEQVVLCGGMPELAIAAFETLCEAGHAPEVAYMECVAQVKLLADLMARYGIQGMRERISDTAEWGAYQVGKRVIGEDSRKVMRETLANIQSGAFARDWIAEAATGKSKLRQFRKSTAYQQVEKTFQKLQSKPSE